MTLSQLKTFLKKLIGTDGLVLGLSSDEIVGINPTGTQVDYLCYSDEKTSGTDGGTFTSGAWRTRNLNTEEADTGGYGSVASNQVTLAAGTYIAQWSAPAFDVDKHKTRLMNVTDAVVVSQGTSEDTGQSTSSDEMQSRSMGSTLFTIAATKAFEVQHYCQTTQVTDGLGRAFGSGNERYTIVEFIRLA
jgi:hypothetical protein